MAIDDPSVLMDYSPDGIDLTLIRWMLSLTPGERWNSSNKARTRFLRFAS